jgi:hydrogenase/urease accessory protein HupE
MSQARLIFFAVLALLGVSTRAVWAHPVGLSRGEYQYRDGKLFAGVTFARRELAGVLPWLRSADGVLPFEIHRDELGRWVADRLKPSADDRPCVGAFDGMRFDGDGVALALSYECGRDAAQLDIDLRFVGELERGHRHLAEIVVGEERQQRIVTAGEPRVSLELAAPPSHETPTGRAYFSFVRMGVEHILAGYDHLLFLIGLVLVGGPARSLVAAITAFTVAHSLTLALAVLGVFAPSPSFIEPCIALSIAYVGIENWFVRDARGRWKVAVLVGLVHGFGFAGALREVALPRSEIPGALFAFNFGVELGQIAVLGLVFPLVLAARSRAIWDRVGLRACTASIALAGLVWFVARVSGSV